MGETSSLITRCRSPTVGATDSDYRSAGVGLDPAVGDTCTITPPTAAMKFVGWNCRGKGTNLGTSRKMEYLARLMHSTGAQVTFVSETRSSECTPAQLNARFNSIASFVVPSEGFSGGGFGCCGLMKFFSRSSSQADILS